ncbi:hypothetical protein PIB30_073858 [Stylosanthes scabra]|uniref:Uncharacterized protein n=1 Tax=Stylosanthes scabra TaxID=79078 RepID=A0ABU6ZNB7_9FABA|nr:hypothetical protein [Stylosanthes scabra]
MPNKATIDKGKKPMGNKPGLSSYFPDYNSMGIGLGTFSKVYHPSREDVQMVKILHRNSGESSTSTEPPDPSNSGVPPNSNSIGSICLENGKATSMLVDSSTVSAHVPQ